MPQYKIGDKVQINDQCYTIAGEPYLGGCADVYPLENEGTRSDFVLKVYNPKGFDDFGQTLINRDVMHGEKETTAAVGNDTFQSPVRIVAAEKNMFIETKLPNDLVSLQKLQGKFKDFTDYERVRASLYIMLSLARFLERLVELGYAHLDLSLTNVFAANINFKSDRLDAVTALVIDFGISRELGTSVEIPAHSGTEPPEYRDVNEYVVSEKTDVYGVGQLLYCLIFFAERYDFPALAKNCSNLELPLSVGAALKSLINRLTAEDIETRPSVRDDELSCELLRMIEIVEGKGFHREIAIEKSRLLCNEEWQANFSISKFEPALMGETEGGELLSDYGDLKNILLLGDGGIGKTTFSLFLWHKLLETAPDILPFYVPLYSYKERNLTDPFYIRRCIKNRYFDCQEDNLPDDFFKNVASVVLLDGINEAECPDGLMEEIRLLSKSATVVIASRVDYNWACLEGFLRIKINPLSKSIVQKMLESCGKGGDIDGETMELLRIPLFLQIYASDAEVGNVHTKSELLQSYDNRILAQIKKGDHFKSYIENLEQCMTKTLPELAFRSTGRSFCAERFSNIGTMLENFQSAGLFKTAGQTEDEITFVFVHEYFVEYYKAKYIVSQLNRVKRDAERKPDKALQIPDCLTMKIPDSICGMVGELYGESAGIKKNSAIEQFLHLPRFLENKTGSNIAIAVRNLIQFLKVSRRNILDGTDFSNLDLTMQSFINTSVKNCCFVGSKILSSMFFAENDDEIERLEITDCGCIVTVSKDGYLRIYDSKYGLLIFKDTVNSTGSLSICGNIIVFQHGPFIKSISKDITITFCGRTESDPMDNNIYWFDSLERKRGILKDIELSEFSRIATSSNFDNLVLYEDKRPDCSVSIACYEIMKSYDGVIGQQLYSPRLKWKLLLDDVLPQYAVPYSDQYLQNCMLDMCMRGKQLKLVFHKRNEATNAFFVVDIDLDTGEKNGSNLRVPCNGYTLLKLDDQLFNIRCGKICFERDFDNHSSEFVEYDLFTSNINSIPIDIASATLRLVFSTNQAIIGEIYHIPGQLDLLYKFKNNPAIKRTIFEDNSTYTTIAGLSAISTNGQFYCINRQLQFNAYNSIYNLSTDGDIISYYLSAEHDENDIIEMCRIPISAGIIGISALNSNKVIVTTANGQMSYYDGKTFETLSSGCPLECVWLDNFGFISYNNDQAYKYSHSPAEPGWIKTSFFSPYNCEGIEEIRVVGDDRTVFVSCILGDMLSLYIHSCDGVLKQTLEFDYAADFFFGFDVTHDGKFMVVFWLSCLQIYEKNECGYVFSFEVPDDGYDHSPASCHMLWKKHLLIMKTHMDGSENKPYLYNIEHREREPYVCVVDKAGKKKELIDCLSAVHVFFKKKAGFVYIKDKSFGDIHLSRDQGVLIYSVILEDGHFREHFVGTASIKKDTRVDLYLSNDEKTLFLVAGGSTIQVISLNAKKNEACAVAIGPRMLKLSDTICMSGSRFGLDLDSNLVAFLKQNGAVFEE